VRAKTAETRVATAVALGRTAAAVMPGANPLGGRREALRVAEEAGYSGRLSRTPLPYAVERAPDGSVEVSVSVDDAGVSFHLGPSSASLASPAIFAATVVALLLSIWIGRALGRTLSEDLAVATRHVRSLGNEEVLRGVARAAGDARFGVVSDLARAIQDLTERFRVFADAQERAIEAREQSLRLRGLLFASVSHDLKSPLNAVLGFCALAGAEPLSSSQLESVAIIERRGRELLALIETILDAARVEASRLQLSRSRTTVREVLESAVLRGDDLGPMDAAPVTVSCPDDLPDVTWDEARMSQALGALVGHAKRLSPAGGVEIAAHLAKGASIELTVTDPSTVFTVVELGRLLDAQSAQTAPGRHGGLALGLSLARALVGLHGGRLIVDRARAGGAVFRAVIPIEPP
jgi:signal transduction histidine kinase